jgi:uncharacterized membrane protein YccC
MQPIWGFVFFALICGLSAIIARKRGNSGLLHAAIAVALGFGFVIVVAKATGGTDPFSAALGGFIGGAAGVLFAWLRRSDAQQAERSGSSAGHKTCKFCAEVVKLEALKCKHCGSDLSG